MVNSKDIYHNYNVTVPVTFYIEATNENAALDIVMQSMNKTTNFHIVRNAHISAASAKIIETPHKTIYHSK